MPRTTRRAARAAEDDATTTIHLDEDVVNQITSTVNGFASTACADGVLEENATVANETWKKAKGTRKGTKKGKKSKPDADVGSESPDKENATDPDSVNGSDLASSMQPSTAVYGGATQGALTPAPFVKQPSDMSLTSSAETTLSFEAPVEPVSEAARNLQSLFQQDDNHDDAQEEASIAEIIARSPSKGSPQSSVSDQTFEMKSLQQALATTHNVEPCLPGPAPQAKPAGKQPRSAGKPVPSARATPKTAAPMSRGSIMSPTKASLAKENEGKGTVEQIKKRSAISALHTPPPVAKSNKPVTKSTFKLPGENLSSKFKAQREERLKRMEDAATAKQAEVRARASSRSKPVEMKGTISSRARQSILPSGQSGASQHKAGQEGPKSTRPKPRASTVNGRVNVSTAMATRTGLSGTERKTRPVPVKTQAAVLQAANVAKARLPASQPMSVRNAVSPRSAAQQKLKGRENFQRARVEQKSQEQVVKEKAEAARKARAEAAERGRQASREWAEKMKARKSQGPTGLKAVETSTEPLTPSATAL